MPETPSGGVGSKKTTSGLALLICCLALWMLAGAIYGGDIGKTRDDYTWAVNDPATGQVAVADLWRMPLFWRPMSLVLVRHLVSLTWDAPWIANLLTALAHGVLTILVWRWFRSLGFLLGARLAAMVFLTLPMAFDVMHWPAAMPTALAGLCAIIAAMVVSGAVQIRSGVMRTTAVSGLAFMACCLNEQAAACLGAIAILPLASAKPLRDRLRSMVSVSAAVALPAIAYVALVTFTAPGNHRGGSSSFAPIGGWPDRAEAALNGTWSQTFGPHGRDLTLGGFEVGVASLGGLGIFAIVVALVAGLIWAVRTRPATKADEHASSVWLMVFGVAWFVLGLVPFVIILTGPIEARHVYLPLLGLLVVVLEASRRLGRLLPAMAASIAARTCAVVALVWATLASVALVGIQSTLRERYQMDMDEAAAIVELYPSPPQDAVIVIARAAWREADTGRRHYDKRFWSAWQMDHIATAVLRHAYGRDDIFAKNRFSIAFGVPASQISEEGWTVGLSDGPAWDGGQWPPQLIEWDRLLLLRIDEEGRVLPIDRLALKAEGQPATIRTLPAVSNMDFSVPPELFHVRLR